MADGKVVISTELDNSGIEKGAGKLGNSVNGALKSVKGTLGGLTRVVAGVTASITAAFSTAAIAITKQAVDAYADYEQLIGGVETLFKGAANKIVANAEDAFYTVGISANEYMETVTSFSASLISALAGDTAKAADIADMALTDMADNANKMGTPLENIKTAYQGFAKQNYTMLDNLKLGYGGTKTEMERLLADAQKLTGIKYNINNLADVYNAIHAIQVEMGIAGTTAKEAEKTITGSANMTKAAWKNVLAAIAGGGDIDRAINNLVYSLSKYFENIVPVVERSLAGLGELIERIAPSLVETVAAALIKAIPSLLNAVYQMIIGLANGIYEGVVALFSGSTKSVSAQLNATKDIADNYNDAAVGASNLADATEEAGKAAKKSLASFDELNKLSDKNNDNNKQAGESVIGGSLTNGLSTLNQDINSEQIASPIITALQNVRKKIDELLLPIKSISFEPAINSLKNLGRAFGGLGTQITDALEWAWFEILTPLADWTIEDVTPAAIDLLTSSFELLSAALEPVKSGFDDLWESMEPIFTWVGDTAVDALEQLQEQFDKVAQVFEEKGHEIEQIFSDLGDAVSGAWEIIEPILDDMKADWERDFDLLGDLTTVWVADIIDILGGITAFLAGAFTGDWTRALNGLIDIANGLIDGVLGGINVLIEAMNKLSFDIPDWIPGIGGTTFGFDIPKITIPQIPELAQGAVLPPNKPFMAVVGDQRYGTNIEAPLATIQEAVAEVMADYEASNLAGHEATVEVLRQLLSAVLGIEVGDTVIGQAANRYNREMAIIKGGL